MSDTDTVLIVEDDEGVLTLTSLVLRNAGYRVLEARDGPEAIEVATQTPDPLQLLICDAVLPSMAGHEVAERVLAAHPGTRVIFISGYARESMPPGRMLKPEHKLLEKPFTPQMLLEKVRGALG